MSQHFLTDYNLSVDCEYKESCDDALAREIAGSMINDEDNGIQIITDARHGWRKNSRQTDVICIGYGTHSVLRNEIITKDDDQYAQRHERLGTKRIYQYLKDHDLGPGNVQAHAHDRNLSVNKYIRENETTTNQNDTWHAGKQVEKMLSNVAKGPLYKEGSTWHRQLSDKVASIRTHIHYSIRNCGQNTITLRQNLDNIVQHYKNVHVGCSIESRCRRDKNYQPSKMTIDDPKAELLLQKAIQSSVVYQHAEDYVMAMDTFYVESFNNVLNMFHDKRVAFGHEEYFRRSKLAVLHWNENVDRPYTSMWTPPEALLAPNLGPRKAKSKKNYVKRTFNYTWNIWNNIMNFIF